MIDIVNLSYYIGDRPLYSNASLFIGEKDKIGLIGLNGTGKSTLLKILIGEMQPSEGKITKSKDTTIGFLNQDLLSFQVQDSILNVVMQADEKTLRLQEQIDEILLKMEANYTDDLVDKLTTLQERFEDGGGYMLQPRAAEILEGIGFKTSDLDRPLEEFSGGWRMRVILAKMLLEKPSLLLLDEPTNHLDLPSIQWIESYLKSYDGAFITVSHDREFLNKTVNKVVEVSQQKLNVYSGNYDFYISEKDIRNELQKNAYDNQRQKIKETERYIERFRAKASKAKQAQSKMKMLERMEKIDPVSEDAPNISLKFQVKVRSGRVVKRIEEVSKSYDEINIFKNTDAAIERGDKIALIGANGKGKTTLLRMLGGLEHFEGKIETGHNVLMSVYAQHQLEALNTKNEILEELKQAGTARTEQELRSVLGCFIFSEDDVFKKISVLSGGEKSRVALAKTLISEANFLLLDEPTNHLDMISVGVLIQALQQYEGTLLCVSHDRHFISQIANKIWWIENGEIKEFLGPYEEYKWWVEKNNTPKSESNKPKKNQSKKKERTLEKSSEKPKGNKSRMVELEKNIATLEASIKTLEETLSHDNVSEREDFHDLLSQHNSSTQKLEQLMKDWEELIN